MECKELAMCCHFVVLDLKCVERQARQLPQGLRALVILVENPGSVPITHMLDSNL